MSRLRKKAISPSNPVQEAGRHAQAQVCPVTVPFHPQAGLWLIGSDAQIPYQDPAAVSVFLSVARALQPVGVILAGDCLDCRTLSTFTKDPADARTLADEVSQAKAILAQLASVQVRVWLDGNHENRLSKFLATKAPELASLPGLTIPSLLGLEEAGWEYRTYGDLYELGDALVTHGSTVSQHSAQSAMKHVQRYHRSVIHGHSHRLGHYWLTTANGTLQGVETGCLCRLDPRYLTPPANWQQGMVLATVSSTGQTSVQLLPILTDADGTCVWYGAQVIRA